MSDIKYEPHGHIVYSGVVIVDAFDWFVGGVKQECKDNDGYFADLMMHAMETQMPEYEELLKDMKVGTIVCVSHREMSTMSRHFRFQVTIHGEDAIAFKMKYNKEYIDDALKKTCEKVNEMVQEVYGDLRGK